MGQPHAHGQERIKYKSPLSRILCPPGSERMPMSSTYVLPLRRVRTCQLSAPEVIGFPESFSQIRAHVPNDALVRNEFRVISQNTIPNY